MSRATVTGGAPVRAMPPVVYAFALSAFALGFTEFVTIGLVPAIAASLRVEVEAIGGAVAVFALGATIGAPVLTALAASWPRKRLLLAAMAVFTRGNVAVALSTSLPTLLAARFGSGLGHGVFLAVASSAATRLVPPERAGAAVATVFGGLTGTLASAHRAGSAVQSSGRNRRRPTGTGTSSRARLTETSDWQLTFLPSAPQY